MCLGYKKFITENIITQCVKTDVLVVSGQYTGSIQGGHVPTHLLVVIDNSLHYRGVATIMLLKLAALYPIVPIMTNNAVSLRKYPL